MTTRDALRHAREQAASILNPSRADAGRLPRADLAVMLIAAATGVVLVLMDVWQRWIAARSHAMFDIDGHNNPETWFHTIVLARAAICAAGVAMTFFDPRRRWLWLVAAAGIAFFSLDKNISLHETVGRHLVGWFNLPDSSKRVAWEVAWSPLILATAAALLVCIWEAPARTKLWFLVAVAGGIGKLGLEALTFPMIHLGIASETGTLYGIEANLEESVQLLGFAALFAGFAQLFVERVWAMARGEELSPEPLPLRVPTLAEVREALTPRPADAPAGGRATAYTRRAR